jgi:hypothetical protein
LTLLPLSLRLFDIAGVLLAFRDVRGSQLKGIIPATWAKLTKLTKWQLTGNMLSGATPKWLSAILELYTL